MDACKLIERSFMVDGHKAIFRAQLVGGKLAGTTFEWDNPPKRISHRFKQDYRIKRDLMMELIVKEINEPFLMVDDFDSRPVITAYYPDKATTREYYPN